jgi:hypothetical protein
VALRVAVLATGGTIATRTDGSGTAVTRTSGRELLGDLPLSAGVAVDAEDVLRVGSCATTRTTCISSPSASTNAFGTTWLARIALAALLCVHDDADAVRAASTEYVDPTTRPPDRPPVARARG